MRIGDIVTAVLLCLTHRAELAPVERDATLMRDATVVGEQWAGSGEAGSVCVSKRLARPALKPPRPQRPHRHREVKR